MSDVTSASACPENGLLRALLDGVLPAEQVATVQAHVDQCSACEAALKQMTVGGESWVGMAASLKERDERTDGPLAAAMERLKTDDGSGDGEREEADPQRTLDFLQPVDDPKLLGKLGQHEITEVVGWGGMGVVLKAYDPSLHRVVAVKVLASHLAYHAVARKRFIREAQAAAAVCHDNVVTIHGIEDGVSGTALAAGLPRESAGMDLAKPVASAIPLSQALPKIIMQFVAGGSLQERIDQDGPLELKEVLRIAMQTAAGLAAAHAQGVVHRDVKPANILLENGVQRVKLTDFGLARVMDDASLTLSGVIAGTPQYMAPEQAWGRDVDARADLFSLGAVMYAMCSGHSPFRARTTMAVLKRVCEDPPRPLRAINPDTPEWLVAIIEKLLAKNPDQRFQSATEVSELLGRWLAHVQQPTVVAAPPLIPLASDRTERTPVTAVSDDKSAVEARLQKAGWSVLPFALGVVLFVSSFLPNLVLPGLDAWNARESLRYGAVVVLVGAAFFWWMMSKASRWLHGSSPSAAMQFRWPYAAEENIVRQVSPDPAASPDRRHPEWSSVVDDKGDLRSSPSAGSGDSGTAQVASRGQLPVKFVLWPLIVVWVLLGLMFAVVLAESGTHNVANFLGFSAIQLLATFVLASVFRAAWNSSSWVVWIASLLFLLFAASLFGYAASYRDAVGLMQWMSALHALSAVAYWLGLLFVRPLFVQESDPRLAAQPFRWRRVLALSGILLVPVMASVIWLMRTANVSNRMALEVTGSATVKVPADPVIVTPARDPRWPPLDERGFPNPQLLSNIEPDRSPPRRAEGVSPPVDLGNHDLFDALPTASTGGLTPPARQGQSAAVAESLKPLLGRWVVLTLQGDDPPFAAAAAGGMGGGAMMSAPYASTPGGAAAVTPSVSEQLRSLEFRDGKLFLNDPVDEQLGVEVQNDRALLLQSSSTGECVRWGVYTIADDRLVICWTSRHLPLPRGFQPKPHEQLVVCRREWSRPSQTDGNGNDVAVTFDEDSKPPKAEMPFSSREAAALQAAWAEKSKSPVEVTNSVGMELR